MALIQILGAGCAKCHYLSENSEQTVQELGRTDVIGKVTDIMKMLGLNPSALPALAINDKIVSAGTLPTSVQIKVFLEASTMNEES